MNAHMGRWWSDDWMNGGINLWMGELTNLSIFCFMSVKSWSYSLIFSLNREKSQVTMKEVCAWLSSVCCDRGRIQNNLKWQLMPPVLRTTTYNSVVSSVRFFWAVANPLCRLEFSFLSAFCRPALLIFVPVVECVSFSVICDGKFCRCSSLGWHWSLSKLVEYLSRC